jgi:hypothetical protein
LTNLDTEAHTKDKGSYLHSRRVHASVIDGNTQNLLSLHNWCAYDVNFSSVHSTLAVMPWLLLDTGSARDFAQGVACARLCSNLI